MKGTRPSALFQVYIVVSKLLGNESASIRLQQVGNAWCVFGHCYCGSSGVKQTQLVVLSLIPIGGIFEVVLKTSEAIWVWFSLFFDIHHR